MKNIFEGAKFGDKFLTRNGRIAICINPIHLVFCVYFNDRNQEYYYNVHKNGCEILAGEINNDYDIVSRYQEPIDEQELNKLAGEYMVDKHFYLGTKFDYMDCRNAYKNGYRSAFNNKAKEE